MEGSFKCPMCEANIPMKCSVAGNNEQITDLTIDVTDFTLHMTMHMHRDGVNIQTVFHNVEPESRYPTILD